MDNSETGSGNSFSNVKEAIAEKLEQAASSLRRASGGCGQQASDWLHHSAEYVRSFDVQKADMELRNRIRMHPGRCLLIGLGAGIFLGCMLRRR